jgi:hypothetical protein
VQFELYDLAKQAQGETLSLDNHEIAAPVNSSGASMNSFLLPCRRPVRLGVSLGLGHNPRNVRPISIHHGIDGLVWWEFKADSAHSFVGLHESKDGPDAITWVFSPQQKALHDLYSATKRRCFTAACVDITDFIGSRNQLKSTWLLSDGKGRKIVSPVGLSKGTKFLRATIVASRRTQDDAIELRIRLLDSSQVTSEIMIEVNQHAVKRLDL